MEISFYLTTFEPGHGPVLHRHPYAEVFIVEAGRATFTVAGEERVLTAGHVVVVDPGQPHRFENSGDGTLRVVSIHPSAEPQQADLPPGG